jgi:hypothetical protein
MPGREHQVAGAITRWIDGEEARLHMRIALLRAMPYLDFCGKSAVLIILRVATLWFHKAR